MNYDLVIVGGGMVGAALALALQNSALRIALIDASPLDSSDDHRLIALNDTSCCFFKNLGIWDALSSNAAAIKQIHVSHQGRFGVTRIAAHEIHLDALGHVVPARYINKALYAALQHIDLIRPARLQTLTQDEESVTLTIAMPSGDEKIIHAKHVIGADGSHSTVRDLLGIAVDKIDYQQSAIVTVTELQRDHKQIAYERFLANGAIAMLPLTGRRCATIWTADNRSVTELLPLNDADFTQALQTQFGYRLGRLTCVTKRQCYPLHGLRAAKTTCGRVVLIGNAAHTVHPIAAQGLNLAIYEVAAMAGYIEQHQSLEQFSMAALPLQFSQQLSHRLSGLFASELVGLSTVRQMGMVGLDVCITAKRYFIERALGKHGRVPTLLLQKEA